MSEHPEYTYSVLADTLPAMRFLELQAALMHPDRKAWVRKVTGVSKSHPSVLAGKTSMEQAGPGRVVSVKYEPQDYGQYKDPGHIETGWLPDPVAQIIGEQAKAHVGEYMLFIQLNHGQTDDQPAGFRRLEWLEPARAGGNYEPRPEPEPKAEPDYSEEPFRIPAEEWTPEWWGHYPYEVGA